MKPNLKIEVIKKGRQWKEWKSESQWKRLKKSAMDHNYEVYLWNMDTKDIIDWYYKY